jgi:hypothetical protein
MRKRMSYCCSKHPCFTCNITRCYWAFIALIVLSPFPRRYYSKIPTSDSLQQTRFADNCSELDFSPHILGPIETVALIFPQNHKNTYSLSLSPLTQHRAPIRPGKKGSFDRILRLNHFRLNHFRLNHPRLNHPRLNHPRLNHLRFARQLKRLVGRGTFAILLRVYVRHAGMPTGIGRTTVQSL